MRLSVIAVILLAAVSLAWASPMNNNDIIKMIKSGLGETVILQSIDSSQPSFDTSADGLIQLKQAGASDAVIQRMLQKSNSGTAPQAAPSPGGECRFRASYNHIGIEDGNRFMDVGFQQATGESNINAGSAVLNLFTLGLAPVSGKAYAVIDGDRSKVRVKNPTPVFWDLNADRGLNPDDLIKLIRLTPARDKRMIAIGEASESLFTSNEKNAFPPEAVIALRFEQTVAECMLEGKKMSVYKAMPIQALDPGEYAIAYGDQSYYSFGVD